MYKVETRIDPYTLGRVTHENFFLSTKATFIQCRAPAEEAAYVSESGSCYWYGTDAMGDYVIRKSDHWCQYYIEGTRKMKRFRARIRSCSWHLIFPDPMIDDEVVQCGKCYLNKFDRIAWKTKRRYDVITSE